MRASSCARCGSPVQQPSSGRPRVYCAVGCRRAVEYELRRLDAAVRYAERQFTLARARRAVARHAEDLQAAQQLVDFWATESDEVKDLLEQLLAQAAPGEDEEGAP